MQVGSYFMYFRRLVTELFAVLDTAAHENVPWNMPFEGYEHKGIEKK